jgi:Transposase DDE domain group 1
LWPRVEWHPGDLYPRVGFIVTIMTRPPERMTIFYNRRGTAEQYIKEGKIAVTWTRLSCCRFAANAVRLQLDALAHNLAKFLRTLTLPEAVSHWSMTTVRDRLVKIGARIIRHGRLITFQMAEVMVSRWPFQQILDGITALRPLPPERR